MLSRYSRFEISHLSIDASSGELQRSLPINGKQTKGGSGAGGGKAKRLANIGFDARFRDEKNFQLTDAPAQSCAYDIARPSSTMHRVVSFRGSASEKKKKKNTG